MSAEERMIPNNMRVVIGMDRMGQLVKGVELRSGNLGTMGKEGENLKIKQETVYYVTKLVQGAMV